MGGGGGRGGLLGAITGGVALKKTEAVKRAAQGGARGGLLSAIAAGGVALKKVDRAAAGQAEAPAPAATGLMGALAQQMLKRRGQLVSDDEDSGDESDGDWSDDD